MNEIKQVPYSLEAEKALIGCLLSRQELVKELQNEVNEKYFWSENNKLIFSVIKTLFNNGDPVDLLTVSNKLKDLKKLDDVGGLTYLTDIIANAVTTWNAKGYAKIIQDKYARRQLIQLSEKLEDAGYDEASTISESIDKVKRAIKKVEKVSGVVKEGTIESFINSFKETVEDEQIEFNETQLQELKTLASTYTGKDRVISFKDIEEQLRNAPPVEKISTKIVGLNNLLHGGLMLETVTVLSACPKSGKTALAMFLTSNMEEYNPLWFALEESTKTLIRKMIKNGLTVPNGYAPAYKKKVSLGWIETRIIEAKEKNKSKVVFIDQLDFIVQQDNQGDRHDLKVAQTMRDIHDMAVRQEVAIVLICHTTSIEPYERPTPKNLRGSSAIWGEADNVLFVWRQCKLEKGEAIYSSNVELSLQANREDGDLGKVKMVFEKGKYIEQEWIDKDFGDFNVKNDFGQS